MRLWLAFNTLFIILVASAWTSNYRLAASENQRLVASQGLTLTKSRIEDIRARRFRDFVEGIGRESGELYIQVKVGSEDFAFGQRPRRRHCSTLVYEEATITICREFRFSTTPVVAIFAVYLLIAGISLWIVRALERRTTRTLVEFLATAGVSLDPDQDLVGIMEKIREIRAQLDAALIKEKTLIDARARAELAEQVAHDIRSPLAALEVVSGDVARLPEDKRILIRAAAGRIRDIANSLHKQRTQTVGVPSAVPGATTPQLLSSLLDPVVSEKRLQFRSQSRVEIELRLDASSYGLFSVVQAVEFKRLVSNLVNNAVEAFGGGVGAVSVGLTSSNGRALVSVQDNGKGIAPEVLAKLGQRGETHGKVGGSGLGLHHARTNAEFWGGTLELSSEVGKGTKVTVLLPLAPAPVWFVPELTLASGKAVVILDDDASIHQIWQGRLDTLKAGERGVQVVHVSTPEEIRVWVRAPASKAREALYLLDYELLGYHETGLSLAEELAIGERTILVTSRYEEPEILEGCRKLKARMIPKGLAGLVPMQVMAVTPRGRWMAGSMGRSWPR